MNPEWFTLSKWELDTITSENIGYGSSTYRSYHQWDGAARRQIEHQHLYSEQQSSNGSLENAGNTGSSSTPYEKHHRLRGQTKQFAKVRPNGSTSKHNRSLGTNRATETNSQ